MNLAGVQKPRLAKLAGQAQPTTKGKKTDNGRLQEKLPYTEESQPPSPDSRPLPRMIAFPLSLFYPHNSSRQRHTAGDFCHG